MSSPSPDPSLSAPPFFKWRGRVYFAPTIGLLACQLSDFLVAFADETERSS
jgi:hypothetical protein